MKHEAVVPLLGDLLQGRLGGTTREEVLSHVTSCDECRSLSETYAVLSDTWGEDGDEHPSSDLIVSYALGEDALDREVRDRVATHVLVCERCANEVEVTSGAEAELAGLSSGASKRVADAPGRRLAPPAIAAGFVLLLLAYPAYLGLFEVPRINHRLAVLETEGPDQAGAAWSGLQRPVTLRSPVRDGRGDVPVVRPETGQTHVTLIVQLGMREEYEGVGTVRLDLRDATDRVRWSESIDERELDRRVDGGFTLAVVPVRSLSAGRWTLAVTTGADSPELVFEAPFEFEPAD